MRTQEESNTSSNSQQVNNSKNHTQKQTQKNKQNENNDDEIKNIIITKTEEEKNPHCKECYKKPTNINELINYKIELFLYCKKYYIDFFNDLENPAYNEKFINLEDKKTKILKLIINSIYYELSETEKLNLFILSTIYINKKLNFFIIRNKKDNYINIYKLFNLILNNTRLKKYNVDFNEYKICDEEEKIKKETEESEIKKNQELGELKNIFYSHYLEFKAPITDCLGCFDEIPKLNEEEEKNIKFYYACSKCKIKNLFCLNCCIEKKDNEKCPYCRNTKFYLKNDITKEEEKIKKNIERDLNNIIIRIKNDNERKIKMTFNNKNYFYSYEEEEQENGNLRDIESYYKYDIIIYDKEFIKKSFSFYKKEVIQHLLKYELGAYLINFLKYSNYPDNDIYKIIDETKLNIPMQALEEIIFNCLNDPEDDPKNEQTFLYILGIIKYNRGRADQDQEKTDEIIKNIFSNYYNLNGYDTEKNDLENILIRDTENILIEVIEDLYIFTSEDDKETIYNIKAERQEDNEYIRHNDDLNNIIISYTENESDSEGGN